MAARKRITEPKETDAPRPGRRGPKPDVTAQKARFLAAFRQVGTIRKACERTKVPRASVNEWLDGDLEFVSGYDLAQEDFVDLMLDTLIALGRGTCRGKSRPNFTAIIAYLNAMHWDFNRQGSEPLERRLFQAVDRFANVVSKYVSPEDLEKLRTELEQEAAAQAVGSSAHKARRE